MDIGIIMFINSFSLCCRDKKTNGFVFVLVSVATWLIFLNEIFPSR